MVAFVLWTALSSGALHTPPPILSQSGTGSPPEEFSLSRRSALLGGVAALLTSRHAVADSAAADKQTGLSAETLAEIVRQDLVDRQFLVTGELTRSIYSEDCTFQDEIDTYTLPKWVKGTKALFVGDKSRVQIVGDVQVAGSELSFQFDEVLCFNIPLQPKVPLKGTLVLKLGDNGLITSYRERWDTSVWATLSKAYL